MSFPPQQSGLLDGRPSAAPTNVRKRQKIIEVEKEQPVFVKKYVDIYEDVVVEKPVENRIEKEVYYDTVVEVPREQIVEVEKETVVEQIKEIPVYREVPYVKTVDIPVQRIVEKSVDKIVEREVRVPVHRERVEDRVQIKPIDWQVQVNEVVHEIPVFVDKEKEVRVPVDKPVYVEKINERRVEVPVYREVEIPVYIDKVVETQVPVEHITEVERTYVTEVEKPVYVDKVIDVPFEVNKIIETLVEVPYETHVERPIFIDRFVEVPVNKFVEVPVVYQKHYDIIKKREYQVPVFEAFDVEVPVPRYVDVPVPVTRKLEQPYETIRENRVEVEFTRLKEVPVSETVEIPVETLRVETKTRERVKEVPLEQEVIKEMVEDVYVEKEYVVNKIIEKPIFVPKVVTRYVDKYVEVKEFVEVPVFREVVVEQTIDKPVEALTRVERLRVTGKASAVPMNTFMRGEVISAAQVQRFNESSRQLAQALEANIRSRAELDHVQQLVVFRNSKKNQVSEQMLQELRRRLDELHGALAAKRAQNDEVRRRVEADPELAPDLRYDASDVPVLQAQIRSIREHNQHLAHLATQGRFEDRVTEVGRQLVATNVSHPRGSVSSRSFVSASPSGSYSSTSLSRSPEPRRSQPVARALHAAPLAARPLRRTSPLPLRREVLATTAQPAQVLRTVQRAVGSPARVLRAGSPIYSGSRSPVSSYSSYSGTPSRSLSPLPLQRRVVDSRLQARAGLAPAQTLRTPVDFSGTFGARSKYQSTVDQVKSKPASGIYDGSASGQLPFGTASQSGQDVYNATFNSNGSKYARPSLSTQYPDSIKGNSGKLIGDYSAAYRK